MVGGQGLGLGVRLGGQPRQGEGSEAGKCRAGPGTNNIVGRAKGRCSRGLQAEDLGPWP